MRIVKQKGIVPGGKNSDAAAWAFMPAVGLERSGSLSIFGIA